MNRKQIVTEENSLAAKAPHLISEFHPSKNVISLRQVSYASNKKIWWQCEKGHEWQASPGNRYRGSGCPDCSGRRLSSENNLAKKCPHLVAEWHEEKNAPLTARDVTPRGKTKVWWICKEGHEWQATTGNRYMGTNCPFCEGRRVSPKYNLEIKFPHLADEWNFKKNGNLKPSQVTPSSSKKVWWICEKGHEWQAVVNSRSLGQKCPYCAGKKACEDNNLAIKHPHLVAEWHEKKNAPLRAQDVTPGSNIKVWWICKWGHEWQTRVYIRSKGFKCPKCNFRSSRLEVRIYCELKYIFPDTLWQSKIAQREVDVFIPSCNLAIEVDGWYWHKSGDRINADIRKSKLLKRKSVDLLRVVDDRILNKKDPHIVFYKNGEYEYNVIVRILNFIISSFNFSSSDLSKIEKYLLMGKYKNEKEYNSILASLPGPEIKNSVASNALLVAEWNYKRNSFSPTQFSCGSKMKVWWICKNGHEWQATIGSRAAGNGCSFCSGKKPTKKNNLLAKKPELAIEWNFKKNGNLKPSQVTPSSSKKVWWICEKGHEWQATVSNRFRGTGCPDCSVKKLSEHHNLAVKYPHLVDEWHKEKNAPLTARDVTPKSFLKVWWICKKGHIWKTTIEKRTRGSGCHYCTGYLKL